VQIYVIVTATVISSSMPSCIDFAIHLQYSFLHKTETSEYKHKEAIET